MSTSFFTLIAMAAAAASPAAKATATAPAATASSAATTVELDPAAGSAITVLRFDFEEDEDREPDGLPDDWNRRRGAGYPSYVKCEIDQKHSHVGDQSLRVKVNGGKVAYYSPFNENLARIEPEFNYVFRGFIRTEGLKNDHAVYTVSFLNSRRQRVQRFETRPVTGTHAKWIQLERGPLKPQPDVRYVVIGCHVDHRENHDI